MIGLMSGQSKYLVGVFGQNTRFACRRNSAADAACAVPVCSTQSKSKQPNQKRLDLEFFRKKISNFDGLVKDIYTKLIS